MSSTPFRPSINSEGDLQRTNMILLTPASSSPNFPNPNTHRFPYAPLISPTPKPVESETGCVTSLASLLESGDCPPAYVPLPPTPPPKDTTPIYGSRQPGRLIQDRPPTPPRRATFIPPPRILPLLEGRQASVPLHPMPSIAFHGPPKLPPRSALRPLNPRISYVPTRPAPPCPKTHAITASGHRSRRYSWTVGIAIFLVGLILLIVGIVFASMNTHIYSSPTGTGGSLNLAAIVLVTLGFGLLTGSATHLLWLFRSRQKGILDSDIESRLKRSPPQNGLSERAGSRISRAGESLSSIMAKRLSGKEKEMGGIELLPLSPSPGRLSRRDSLSSSSSRSPPLSLSRTHPAFEHTAEYKKERRLDRRPLSPQSPSKVRSFLDLDDAASRVELDTSITEDTLHRGRCPTESLEVIPGPSQTRDTKLFTRDGLQIRTTFYATPKYNRSDRSVRPSTIKEAVDVEEPDYDRMQNVTTTYTAGLSRLDRGREPWPQRHGSLSSFQDGQSLLIPELAVRARADIAAALGPSIRLSPALPPRRSKGKQKAARSTSILSESSDSDTPYGYVKRPPRARISQKFSAANHPFPFTTTSSTNLGIPGPPRVPVHNRASSDSQLIRPKISPQPTNSLFYVSPPAPSREPPTDLLARISQARKRAESGSAVASPPVTPDKDPIDPNRFSGPLLPATVYTPTRPSLSRPPVAGAEPVQPKTAAAATTASLITTISPRLETTPPELASRPVSGVSAAESTTSTVETTLQSSELASDRETWARRTRGMFGRRWSQDVTDERATVRPLFWSLEG